MICPYCTGTTFTEGDYDLAQVVNLQPVLIRNVHGYRCDQCGYIQVSRDEMKRVEERLAAAQPNTFAPAAVYDLAKPLDQPQLGVTPAVKQKTESTLVCV